MALVLPLVLSVAFLLTTPETVQTCTMQQRCGSEFYYFSDSSHSIVVGYRSWNCGDCAFTSWGTISNYKEWYPLLCCP